MDNLFFMSSPIQPLFTITLYLIFVLKLEKFFMENREPFRLKKVLVLYNLSQVFFNLYIFMNGKHILSKITFSCSNEGLEPEDIDTIVDLGHKYILLKIYDLLDTVFFVLRKKQNQVSFLHVYHHVTVFIFPWAIFKYYPISQNYPASPGVVLGVCNTLVHTVMYSYYLVSVVCGNYVKSAWWKKYITLLQIFQQFIFVSLGLIALLDNTCSYPKELRIFGFSLLLVMIVLFIKFYQRAYGGQQKKIYIDIDVKTE